MPLEPQVATVHGHVFYRHTNLGDTKGAKRGEELPILHERPGEWIAYVDDNALDDLIRVFVLIEGGVDYYTIRMSDFPEVDGTLNIRGMFFETIPRGMYRIISSTYERFDGHEAPSIVIVKIGEIDEEKLVHLAAEL